MTAEQILRLNGDLKDSPILDAVRRFHEVATARSLPYCVVGGLAVLRNGHPRMTIDIDVLTLKSAWEKILPLGGKIVSRGLDQCTDRASGVTIDILFADEEWGMVIPMPDPREAGEHDEALGATFMGLHPLVQLKTAVYLDKLAAHGPATAAKDLADVQALIQNNLSKFSREVIKGYPPPVQRLCLKVLKEISR